MAPPFIFLDTVWGTMNGFNRTHYSINTGQSQCIPIKIMVKLPNVRKIFAIKHYNQSFKQSKGKAEKKEVNLWMDMKK